MAECEPDKRGSAQWNVAHWAEAPLAGSQVGRWAEAIASEAAQKIEDCTADPDLPDRGE